MNNGTIGSLPAEISLNNILIRLNDVKMSHRVMQLHQEFKQGAKQIAEAKNIDRSLRRRLLRLFEVEIINKINNANFPDDVLTHLCCSVVSHYRNSLKRIV